MSLEKIYQGIEAFAGFFESPVGLFGLFYKGGYLLVVAFDVTGEAHNDISQFRNVGGILPVLFFQLGDIFSKLRLLLDDEIHLALNRVFARCEFASSSIQRQSEESKGWCVSMKFSFECRRGDLNPHDLAVMRP